MNLYEFEGKDLFKTYEMPIPRGVVVRDALEARSVYQELDMPLVVVKAQVLAGKRGKNNAIRFCSNQEEVVQAVEELLRSDLQGKEIIAVRIEEALSIAKEHYLAITYDTNARVPICMYNQFGGVDIESEDVSSMQVTHLDIRNDEFPSQAIPEVLFGLASKLWKCFREEDARLVEINPVIETTEGQFVAADAKIILDDDAFFRHESWKNFEPRTMMGRAATARETAVMDIDAGENYYRGTAGKYVEMDGNIAILFSGGGASIANMDALIHAGGKPANYTEYSGNPPREKVYQLTKIVLSKPGLRGLWIAGGVANFTNIQDTFQGIVDALDEIKPTYPIVIRRAGPHEKEGVRIMEACAARNNLDMKIFGKEVSMSETAKILMNMVENT